MHVRPLVLLPLLTLLGSGDGDLARTFGRDNAEFARGLFRNGYSDLAERFCAAFEKSSDVDAKEKQAVRSVHLDLRLDLARDEKDPLKRKEMISDVLRDKEEFIKSNPQSSEAEEAAVALPDGYRLLCDAITSALPKTTDPEQAKKLREDGAKAFNHAEEMLVARKRNLEAKVHDPNLNEAETEKVRDQVAFTWYNLARTEYFHAQLYAAGDPERSPHLKSAMKSFQDFSLEYEDKLLNYEGLVFQGLCEQALAHNDDALNDFDQAIALRERFDPAERGGGYKTTPEAESIIAWAVLKKMLLLGELGRDANAIAAAKDFFAKSQTPYQVEFGLAALAAQAEAELKTGDTSAANRSAQTLQEKDPQGPWGEKGREILAHGLGGGKGGSSGATLGAAQLLKIAESQAQADKLDDALRVCARALDEARATSGADAICVDALILIGACYAKQKDYLSAAVALDAAVEGYPKAEKAGEALYRAISCYTALNNDEKRAFYQRRIDERWLRLANEYPKHPRAADVQLLKGRQLEKDQKYLEAADFYLKVPSGTSNHPTAQFSAGACLFQEAQRLVRAKQLDQAKPIVARADEQLKRAIDVLDAAAGKTLDLDQKSSWEKQSFECRRLLANLYMLEGVGRAADVAKVLEGVDERYKDDLDRLGDAWGLRIQALNALGKLNEAESLLEALLQKSPDSRSSAVAAGVFASSCDKRAIELFAKDPKSKEGDDAWRKAFRYYVLSMKPKLKDAAAARKGDLQHLADRFFLMGQHFNGIPENVTSFVAWRGGKITAPDYFEQAADTYAASVAFVPSYMASIYQARALGFLGRYKEAAAIYSKLVEQEQLVDVVKGEINKAALASKPALMAGYLESGVCEYLQAQQATDAAERTDHYARANGVFELILKTLKTSKAEPNETWWRAKYYQLRALLDEGLYKPADLLLRNLERTTNDFDEGKYGLRDLFKKMKSELAGKVFDNNSPGSGSPAKGDAAGPPGHH